MRTLIVTELMSLDGGLRGARRRARTPAHRLDRCPPRRRVLRGQAAWPQRDGEFADKMNRMPKHVVTSTTCDLEWEGSARLDGDPVTAVADLKATDGGPLLVAGSLSLAQTLLAAGLVDELRLAVFPAVVGGGQRLLVGDRRKLPFALAPSPAFDSGIVLLVYRAVPA